LPTTFAQILFRATILQQKSGGQPVQFEITDQTRELLTRWIERVGLKPQVGYWPDWPFP
jgi:hypothetical protein